MKSQFKGIVFDLDGTLIDSKADLADAVNFALITMGQDSKPDDIIVQSVGNGLHNLLLDVFGHEKKHLIEGATKAFEDYYGSHCVDKTQLYPGVAENIQQFNHNFNLSVVTNKPKHFADKILDSLNIKAAFDVVIGGESLPQRKPHPEPVFEAIKIMGCEVKNSIIVGDGHQDMKAGINARISTCLASYGYGFHPETLELKPDFCIKSFMELKEILK